MVGKEHTLHNVASPEINARIIGFYLQHHKLQNHEVRTFWSEESTTLPLLKNKEQIWSELRNAAETLY